MAETDDPDGGATLTRIEPGDRLVVLARTIQAPDPGTEATLTDNTGDAARLGEACLGRALYRHRSVYKDDAEAAVWSHLELSYFRAMVPADVIRDLVLMARPAEAGLLRAEILLTTPSSFILLRDWRGSAGRPEWQASLEYIQVHPANIDEYRTVMREFCGPAAQQLVRAGRFGTFRAMETSVVLYHDPDLKADWNQIHLCELDPEDFDGFGREFESALRGNVPDDAGIEGTFAGLDRMRTVPRWTFNNAIVEADIMLSRQGRTEP